MTKPTTNWRLASKRPSRLVDPRLLGPVEDYPLSRVLIEWRDKIKGRTITAGHVKKAAKELWSDWAYISCVDAKWKAFLSAVVVVVGLLREMRWGTRKCLKQSGVWNLMGKFVFIQFFAFCYWFSFCGPWLDWWWFGGSQSRLSIPRWVVCCGGLYYLCCTTSQSVL